MTTRLYFIVAREAPFAVVFRRGPTRQVELLAWDLQTDRITAGQWLKGRIYERRCDLSPRGDLLLYFAAKYETRMRTWTAISRPPFLTALALWPKGDAWGGGGLFDTARRVRLNHRPDEMKREADFRLAPSMQIEPLGMASGWGEDDPIHDMRMLRDGWRHIGPEPEAIEGAHDASPWIEFPPPATYERSIGRGTQELTLRMSIEGLKEQDGPWYLTRYDLMERGSVVRSLGRADWADAAPNGDLLLAQDGRLLRLAPTDSRGWAEVEPRLVGDISDHVFERREAPEDKRLWP